MIKVKKEIQNKMIITTMEELVPEDNLYRKIDKYIDFTFIEEEVKDLYSLDNGRPSDPIVMFKIVFIQYIDGIKSMRETCKRIKTDAAYRWFLNIPFGEDTPHFSTFSKLYERKFKDNDIFEKIFINIVNQADNYGLVGKEETYTDSTHKKANANIKKCENQTVTEIKKRRLDIETEINEERISIGKKAFDYQDGKTTKNIKVSTTDPESGYYHRSNKEKGFMYLDHRTVDGKSNIIIDAHITKGNVHDSNPFISRMEYIKKTYGWKPKKCGLDSGYDNLEIKEYFVDNNIFGVIAYRSYQQGDTEIRKWRFKYLEKEDVYICPETGLVLEYKNIDKLGYKEYSNSKGCKDCPYLAECCGKNKYRKIRRHIKEEINEILRNNRISEEGKEIAQKRRETVERSFADSKCNHGFRYAMYKGVTKNQDYTWLSCAAQNMKNIAIKIDRYEKEHQQSPDLDYFFYLISKKLDIFQNFFQIKTLSLKN